MMIASELGVTRAPAAPWSARAAINVSIVGASAHARDSTPNAPDADREHTSFAVDVSERPTDQDQRSERQEIRVRHPLLAGSPPPRSRSIAGSATLTIVPSIVATPEPRIAATEREGLPASHLGFMLIGLVEPKSACLVVDRGRRRVHLDRL